MRLYPALLLIYSVFIFNTGLNGQVYSRIKVTAGYADMLKMLEYGIPVDDARQEKTGEWIMELSESDLGRIKSLGLDFDILIDDVAAYYVNRNKGLPSDKESLLSERSVNEDPWPVPGDFELGSVGGFCSINEMKGHLENMISSYPNLISPLYSFDSLSYEGRTIYWVRISDNPGVNETGEPEILYTGMHHAREPIGMQLLLFFMYHLLENYETDETAQYLIDNFELIFVPVINVDGYAYNISTNPYGGGMWRKTRRDNGDGSFGVDPNRNYGYFWGYDNSGSSPYASDGTYRGPYPFSEPCIFNLRDFCEASSFRIALNYHSYSNLLLYPWGYTPTPCPDDDIFLAHGKIMTRENGYAYGAGSTTIYPTNGGSDDWMYGEQETKELIFSYTPEVGSSFDGFWPSVDRIIPLCQENMWQNIMAAKLAGVYGTVSDQSPIIIGETSGNFDFQVQRLGLADNGSLTVSITPLNAAIAETGGPVVFDGLDILGTASGSVPYVLDENILPGDQIRYLLSIDNGLITESDTIIKVYGEAVTVFEDLAESLTNWTSNKWNTTTAQYYSPDRSIADSPYGNYDNYENNSIILTQTIDLTETAFAVLEFYARWDIEAGYDYVQVMAADNSGSLWIPLEGKHTKPGNGNQANGEPVYDGLQEEWVKEEIILEQFCGKEINLRFNLKSDSYVTGDGFFWDNMRVITVDMATGTGDGNVAGQNMKPEIFPNPASDFFMIDFKGSDYGNRISLSIFNAEGRLMLEESFHSFDGKSTIDLSGFPRGIYFYRLTGDSLPISNGKLLVQ